MGNEVDIVIKATATQLQAQIDKAQASLDSLNAKRASPKVDLDIAAAEASRLQLVARLDELQAKRSTPKVDADIAAAQAKLAILDERLRVLGEQKAIPKIDVDIAAAEARLAVLKAELEALGDKHVEVNVDTDKGIANIRKLAAEGDSLAAKFKSLDLGSGMASSISAAIIPAIQSIGQLSGALGLIPAMATGAATAFGAVAIGVQGMDTALKASEKSIKANEAASKADQAAATANAAALNTSTSATTNHIAALKQHGAEITALIAKLNAQKLAGQNVTSELAAAKLAQASNTAELKAAQAAYTGNSSAIGANASAQKTAQQATTEAAAAHKAAAKAADEQAAAMKDLAPAAQAVVSQLIQLKPAWDDLHKSVQQALFQGLATQLKELANTVLPVVKTGLTQMATALNGIVTEITTFMSKASSLRDWKQIFTDLATTAHNFAGAIQPILQIFTDLVAVGASMLPGLAKGFADAMQKAADFVSKARETGQLREWIQTGIDACKTLWGIFSDLVQIIAKVTAAPGPGLLDMIKGILDVVLQLITQFPILIPLVEGFIAAWAIAKLVQGITGMIATIKTLGEAIALATTKVKAFGTASTVAGAESEAAATKAGVAWKALGLLVAGAVAASVADSILPQAKAGDNSPMAGMRNELHQIAEAIKEPKKAWEDFVGELKNFGGNFNFSSSPFMQGLRDMGTAVTTMGQTAKQGFDQFKQGATDAMTGMASAVSTGFSTVRSTISSAFSTMAQTATTGWEQFKQGASAAWTDIGTTVSGALSTLGTTISSAFQTMSQTATTGWEQFKQGAGAAWTDISSTVSGALSALGTTISSAFQTMAQTAQTGWQSFVQGATDALSQMSGIGDAIVKGIGAGIQAGWSWLQDTVSQLATQLFNAAKAALGIASPSKKFRDEIGAMIPSGISLGITANGGQIQDSINQLLASLNINLPNWGGGHHGGGGGSGGGVTPPIADLGVGAASGLSGPMAPYMIRPNYDFGSLYNTLNPPPLPSPGGGGSGGGHHGGHGHHGGGGFDLDKLADALKGALHDVFSGGIKTDVDYNSLTLRLNQVTRSNARR